MTKGSVGGGDLAHLLAGDAALLGRRRQRGRRGLPAGRVSRLKSALLQRAIRCLLERGRRLRPPRLFMALLTVVAVYTLSSAEAVEIRDLQGQWVQDEPEGRYFYDVIARSQNVLMIRFERFVVDPSRVTTRGSGPISRVDTEEFVANVTESDLFGRVTGRYNRRGAEPLGCSGHFDVPFTGRIATDGTRIIVVSKTIAPCGPVDRDRVLELRRAR